MIKIYFFFKVPSHVLIINV